MLEKLFSYCGNSKMCSDAYVIYVCLLIFFAPHRAATLSGRTLSPRPANCSRSSGKKHIRVQ